MKGKTFFKKLSVLAVIPVCLFIQQVFAEDNGFQPGWDLYIEMDRMLALKLGGEYRITPDFGIKTSAGVSLISATLFSYNLTGVYHFMPENNAFQLDAEFGLPLANFDFLEDTVVDWDPHSNGPFAGWGPGVSLCPAYQFGDNRVGLRVGALAYMEIQRGGEFRTPGYLTDVSVEYTRKFRE